MIIILTEHAKVRMAQKAITIENIKIAIQRGAKIRQTDGLLTIYAELEVAYKIAGERYLIKTVKIR